MPAWEIKTMQELEEKYYGSLAPRAILKDDDLITTTTGVYFPIYGRKVWVALNQEANAFAALPKEVWTHSGWRLITGRSSSSGGGVAETGAVPATEKPTFTNVSTKPKLMAHCFGVSELEQILAQDDNLGDPMRFLREHMASQHKEMINVALLTDGGTPASTNFESIDRAISSYVEVANCKEYDGSTSYSTNDLDIYGLDRDTNTAAYNAVVLHNSSNLRDLSLDLIDQLCQKTWEKGADPNSQFFLTGYDTLRKWEGLLQAQQRFYSMGERQVEFGVGGVRTKKGAAAGFPLASYCGIPIITSKNVVVDQASSGGISRIYLIDTRYMTLRIARPTQYFESGIDVTGDPFSINKFGNEGVYRTVGELICYNFTVQGKVRDLK
jgi:hypothetical protein